MDQNSVIKSNCRILQNVISQEISEWWSLFLACRQTKIEVFYNLILSIWVFETMYARSTQKKKFACVCNISRKAWGIKLIFFLQIRTKVFCKFIVSLWVCVARRAQSTQRNKFTISLQYLNENVKDEVHLLPADKRQKFSQIDTIVLGVWG